MRGRKPKPAARQIVEGDPQKRGVHKLQERLEAEPEARRGLPDCPRHIKGRAREAWEFWVEELVAMNLDHRPDAMMLEGACVNYESAVRAYEHLLDGEVVEEPVLSRETGEVVGYRQKKSPWVLVRDSSWQLMRSFCSEFGLSPVSRTRLALQAQEKKPEDLMELLSAPRERRTKSETETVQ